MKEERYFLDIESEIIFDTKKQGDFDPVRRLNEQDQQITELQKNQTQKAIECLRKIRYFIVNLLAGNYDRTMEIICEQIDYNIKELEGK